jgi:hypothetical protein
MHSSPFSPTDAVFKTTVLSSCCNNARLASTAECGTAGRGTVALPQLALGRIGRFGRFGFGFGFGV